MADYEFSYTGPNMNAYFGTIKELYDNGYIFKGVATPSTNPGTTTEKCAYIASEAGTYTNFGNLSVTGLSVLTYNGTAWSALLLNFNVVQTTGNSINDVMSQKAVTDALNAVDLISVEYIDVIPDYSNTGVYYGLRVANAVVDHTFSYTRESTSSTYICGYINVSEGDEFIVTMNSGSYYRTCVLLDANNVIQWTSAQGSTTNRTITIGAGIARLAFNYDSTKSHSIKKKTTLKERVDKLEVEMPTKADKSILVGITPKSFTASNSNHTFSYVGGVLTITTNVAAVGYAESDIPSASKPWRMTFKARITTGSSQFLYIGLASSTLSNNTKSVTIDSSSWTDFSVSGTGTSAYLISFTIAAANAVVGNVVEIKDIVVMSENVQIPINTLSRLDALDNSLNSKITTISKSYSCNGGNNALYVGLRVANAVVGNTFNYGLENSGYSSGYIDVLEGDVVFITLTSLPGPYYKTGAVLDNSGKITRVFDNNYTGTITIAQGETRIVYSCAQTSNDGFVVTRQLYVEVEQIEQELADKSTSIAGKIFTFSTGAFLQSCDRYSKYLVKIACCGDSLIANAIGGSIPSNVDEGNDKVRPMRLTTNGIPRRLYDMISWHKPIWRRLDHTDWSKSGFTYQYYNLFRGINPGYWQSTAQDSYAQITIPQGYEHFALICRQMKNGGTLNVTLNGSAVGTYPNPYYTSAVAGNSVITTDVVPENLPIGPQSIDLTGTTANGNFYHIVQFNNLPSGQANTIRFETASSAQCDIWGGFYWTGNSCVVMNLGHGGHTTSQLISWMTDEVYNEDYDAILFEVPEMNNLRLSLAQTKADLTNISNHLRSMDVDHCFTSCNILGISISADTNYYADNLSPSQLEVNDTVRQLLYEMGEPFIDIFQYFRWHTERRGGTLLGGQAGLWYTHDGQHGNPEGVKLWFDCLKKVIVNKSIMID